MTEQTNKETEPIVVVFAIDDKVAMPLSVAIQSLITNFLRGNSTYRLAIYVLDMGISEENKEKIRRYKQYGDSQEQINISFIPLFSQQLLTEIFEDKNTSLNFSPAILARLLIPHLLHEKHSRIIYLDADILVLDDISKLWEIDLQGFPLGAGRDIVTYYDDDFRTSKYIMGGDTTIKAKLVMQRKYFNSGVLVFNDIRKLQSEGFSEVILELAMEKAGYAIDQDALNIYFEDQVLYLPQKWNFLDAYTVDGKYNYTNDYYNTIRDTPPCIVHYAAFPKPWNSYQKRYLYNEWYRYLEQTNWRGWRPSTEGKKGFDRVLGGAIHCILYRSRAYSFLLTKALDTLFYSVCWMVLVTERLLRRLQRYFGSKQIHLQIR
ncbi:MAG: glycosyltransferase family 8 protein [Chloroflexota bacterium]